MYVFLAPIDLEIDIAKGLDGRVSLVGVTSLADETNSEAVASFLRARESGESDSDCIGRVQEPSSSGQRSGQTGKMLPLARPCLPFEKIIDHETLMFVLPELTPPAAVQRKEVPLDRTALVAAVHRYMGSRRYCGAMTGKIPFYSDADPRVYVFLQARGDCPQGVATFSRSPQGAWEFGKFFPDVSKEQVSGIMAHIKSNTAITVDY